jgi:hypothetical protein
MDKSAAERGDKGGDEPGLGRLAYGYPDPDELHKLLDEAEVGRKISMDGGTTWRTYSVAERLKILVGGYKLAVREGDEAEAEVARLSTPSAGVACVAEVARKMRERAHDLGVEGVQFGNELVFLDEQASALEAVAPSARERRSATRLGTIEECASLAECADPNDGRDHTECPFCSIAREIRKLATVGPTAKDGQ